MNLYCATCDVPHDLDLGPDEGVCLVCGGPLVEDPKERELVYGSDTQRVIADAGAAAIEKLNARRPAPKGAN